MFGKKSFRTIQKKRLTYVFTDFLFVMISELFLN